ncbi:hypothetical protein [Rubrivivax sp. JA1026]|uniref:hypothetical protein n=1 Tax=Rubrivivax sp. JA1026 TaxID=2710888 RepID=UPI0013E948BE|nr:hypothetical protein [Rubrivivax sp. JA1026]
MSTDLRTKLLALANRRTGVTMLYARRATDASEPAILAALQALVQDLEVTYRAPEGVRWARWFGFSEDADAWVESLAKPQAQAQPKAPARHGPPLTNIPSAARQRKGLRLDVGADVQPPGVKFTRGPTMTHDPRFQCDPTQRHYGAGFAAAGIGRDVTTGKGWGQ